MANQLLPPPTYLHILVFAPQHEWQGWLEQASQSLPYELTIEETNTPRALFLRMVHQLPHLLLIDLDSEAQSLQQVLGFMERTCPFVPRVGISQQNHHDLSEWQREILPARLAADHPEELEDFLAWAQQLKKDDRDQARRMRIMQQIERNLKALSEMNRFFEEGSRLPNSFSQQTQQEIATSKRYLEALREKLRRSS